MNDPKLLIDILGSGFEIYLIILLFESVWERSITKTWLVNTNIALITTLYAICITLFQNSIALPVIAFGIMVYFSFLYKSSIQSKLFFSLISFSLSAFSEIVTGITLSIITNSSVKEVQANMLAYFMGVFTSKIIVLVIIKAIKYFKKENKRVSNKFFITMISAPLYSLVLAFIIYILAYDSKNIFVTILSEISTIILVLSNIFIFTIIEKQSESEHIKQQYELSQQHLDCQIRHYTDLYDAQIQTRRIQHDIKNNLIAINGLLYKNQIEDAKDYINKISDEIGTISLVVDNGIPVIDAILSAKIQQAAEINIVINYKIIIEKEIVIDSMDLAVLLANALDNAIEGCCGSQNPQNNEITLKIYNSSEYLSIKIENYTSNEINTSLMQTTKPDKNNHGFGLQQIRTIAQKYQGRTDIEFDAETKKIQLLILIKNIKI
jgi:two-component system sensor histidine kinase AgrC